jgi:hypothetical protein
MEDQAGFEPAVGLRHRIKSPTRSAATVTGPRFGAWFGGCGGTRTRVGRSRATRLKVWPVRRSGHTSGAFVCAAHFVSSSLLVVEEGFEPSATRLSAGALAIRTLYRLMVRPAGIEPAAFAMSKRRSPAELRTRCWYSRRDSNPGMSVCRTDAFVRLATGARRGAGGKSRTCKGPGFKPSASSSSATPA